MRRQLFHEHTPFVYSDRTIRSGLIERVQDRRGERGFQAEVGVGLDSLACEALAKQAAFLGPQTCRAVADGEGGLRRLRRLREGSEMPGV